MSVSWNDNADIRTLNFGRDHMPLLIIDNALNDPKWLIDFALQQQNVLPAKGLYPGLRSPAPDSYKNLILQNVLPLIQPLLIDGNSVQKQAQIESYYSLVSTPLSELKPAQCIPHFDFAVINDVAVLHYLCDDSHGGTSFYRHRSSGYEWVDKKRQQDYFSRLDQEVQLYGLPQEYINGDTALFECIRSVPARFNRMLVYSCASLHSGDISRDYNFDLNPLTGRFTLASFISG
ncbi:DUF6445 family protein [Neptunicella marina]|uniref:Uncharacterized protein n=1 Tax=Neptunicella marina TaxID=2125989 RepID=A0A8J6IU20_9ALTE|nr:DUF6445 family protein [Neptunicella marina]MBC3765433.1 hypothetical protein [Neptunicella marina]